MDQKVVDALMERYSQLHPLMRHRSLNQARTVGDLFDILDTVPSKMPVKWDEEERRWVTTDLLQLKQCHLFAGD